MAYERLVQYIIEQHKKGYSFEKTKEFLLRSNYPKNVVDYALLEAGKSLNQPFSTGNNGKRNTNFSANTNGSKGNNQYFTVLNFAKSQISKGFNPKSVQDYLISYGYSPRLVDRAVREAKSSAGPLSDEGSRAALYVALVFFLFLFSLGVVLIFFVFGEDDGIIENYQISVRDDKFEKGTYLAFSHSYTSIDGSDNFEVNVEYTLQTIEPYEEVFSWSDSLSAADLDGYHDRVIIDESFPEGEYVLRSVVTYGGYESRDIDGFIVFSDDDPSDDDPSDDDPSDVDPSDDEPSDEDPSDVDPSDDDPSDDDPSDDDSSDDDPSDDDSSDEDPSDDGPSDDEPSDDDSTYDYDVDITGMAQYEILQMVRNTDDKQKGISICEEIQNKKSRDDCYNELAKGKLYDSEVCGYIDNNRIADSCYMEFVRNNDEFSLCEKIHDSYVKLACDTLEQTHDLSIDDEDDVSDVDAGQYLEAHERYEREKIEAMTPDINGTLDDFDLINGSCSDYDCFEIYFNECEPANFTSIDDDGELRHGVLNEVGSLCRVETEVRDHFNSDYVNLTMACNYNNTLSWSYVFDEILDSFHEGEPKGDCAGELYETLVG